MSVLYLTGAIPEVAGIGKYTGAGGGGYNSNPTGPVGLVTLSGNTEEPTAKDEEALRAWGACHNNDKYLSKSISSGGFP